MPLLRAKVIGMSCVSCANTIQKVLNSQGMEVFIDFPSSTAYINVDDEKILNNAREKLHSFGYDILIQRGSDEFIRKERKNLILSWAFSVPIFFEMFLMILGIHIKSFFVDLLLFILSSVIVLFFGRHIHRSGLKSLIILSPNMDSLISIGTIVSLSTFILSIVLPIDNFSGESAIIMNIFLLGNYIKSKSTILASSRIESLYSLLVNYANLLINGNEVRVDIKNVKRGDIVIVKPGEMIPLDGVIVNGSSYIDESSITGESLPKSKSIGDSVLGGTINVDGYIEIKVEREYQETVIKKIVDFVERSENSQLPIQTVVDKVVLYFVPIIFTISLLTFVLWLTQGDISKALVSSIAVLVIACPCALGLAVPLAIKVGFGMLASKGILLKNSETIEKVLKVDSVVFDKTGTITLGKPKVKFSNLSVDILSMVSAIESKVNHPISSAIVDFSKSLGIDFSDVNVDDVKNIPGKGVEGIANGVILRIFKPDNELKNSVNTISIVYVFENGRFVEKGYIEFEDGVKDGVRDVIEYLTRKGLEVFLLTGDGKLPAKKVAYEVGIPERNVFYDMLPEDKVNMIKKLKEGGRKVMFVGDGINDAPSIKESYIGVAMSTGSDITSELGDVIIVGSRLKSFFDLFEISKRIHSKILQNLFYAFTYNIVAIPIAAIGFLTPGISQLIMSISSISVVMNSLILGRKTNF